MSARSNGRKPRPTSSARSQARSGRSQQDHREAAYRSGRRGCAGRDRQGREEAGRRRLVARAAPVVPGAACELTEFAPAKVNLTLHVLGRRPDGYHEIESLVVFADVGDWLRFVPGETLELAVQVRTASAAGASGDTLVLKSARALAER